MYGLLVLVLATSCLWGCGEEENELTCADQGGVLCESDEVCSGKAVQAPEEAVCCIGECQAGPPLLDCSQLGGAPCEGPYLCDLPLVASTDIQHCCQGVCALSSPSVVAAPWLVRLSSGQETTLYFGEYGDTPVSGDYDGDGVTDLAVWRRYRHDAWEGPSSTWLFHSSVDDTVEEREFGDPGAYFKDWPVQADYDGDGRTDMAYFRESDNVWTIKQSSDDQVVTRTWDPWPPGEPYPNADDDFIYGWHGEWQPLSAVPMAADYDGDGKADLMAFRPYNGQWKVKQTSDEQVLTLTFGRPGTDSADGWDIYDLGVPADYDGDGRADLAVRRPVENVFSVVDGQEEIFGEKLGVPAVGDYDGDGRADFGIFLDKPVVSFEYITGDLTTPGVEWSMRESSPTMMEDDGAYWLVSCGESGYAGMPDAVYLAKSTTSPTAGFGEKKKLILDGCHSTLIKVPADINPTFSAACGVSQEVYLLYTEADSWPRSGVDMSNLTEPEYFADSYRCARTYMSANERINACNDTNNPLWDPCCNLPLFPKGAYNGNKIVLYYSCDPDAATPWTRYGPVIELDTPAPAGSTPGNPYGQGHPNAQFINGEVYITHYSHNNNTDGSLMHKHTALAVAADGVSFTKYPFTQTTVGQETHYLELADTFLGVGNAGLHHFLFWGKDIGGMRSWVPQGVWVHLLDDMSAPRALECGMSPGLLRNKHGIVQGSSTYVYGSQWTPNYACHDPDDPAGHPLADHGTWSLNSGNPYATRVDFDIAESRCLGSRFRKLDAVVQERVCTATGWSPWENVAPSP
ncbi:MAG: hypothetical protein DRI90_10355 [Deltaproteobacteria bacterium]|nr:MAG: hypothetical protein DRI90_10355 [Deltaproteobacteria bacterium]